MAVLNLQRRLILALAAGLSVAGAACMPAQAVSSLEYAVKAAYLVKFIPFIDWPDTVFSSPAQPITVCILGDDPFGGALDAQAGQKPADRPVAVKHVTVFDMAANCQILFIGHSAAAAEALAAARNQPVITVTDSDSSLHGIISFVIEANHVRFDIDDAAAAAGGLKISSKLLELAHAVKRRGTP